MMSGLWFKVDRDLIHWDIYQDENPTALKVLLYLMATSNLADSTLSDGRVIKKGQTVFSYRGIAKALNISENKVRTAIKRLVATHKITQQITHHYSIATLENTGVSASAVKKTTRQTTHSFTPSKDNKEEELYDFGKGLVLHR